VRRAPLRAILFDFDGVLADSEPLHYRALRDSLAPEGIEIGEDEYSDVYLAYDDQEAVRIALERHGRQPEPGTIQALVDRKTALFGSLIHEVRFFPGARELVRASARELPLAIVSGARRQEIETILETGELRDPFSVVVGADDVSRHKPLPEPYLEGLERLRPQAKGLRAEECLVFEDSEPGIAAGLAAGMRVVAVAHSLPAARLGTAHHVVADLEGLDVASLRALFED